MPNAFPFHASPFDCLTAGERALVRQSVDIVYYPADAVILAVDDTPQHLHIIIKGVVQQCEGEDVIAVCGPEDCFDARGLVAGRQTIKGRGVKGKCVRHVGSAAGS